MTDLSADTVRSYGPGCAGVWHRHRATLCAVTLLAGSFSGRWVPLAVSVPVTGLFLACAWAGRRRAPVLVLLFVAGMTGASREWGAPTVPPGECAGTVRLVDDPRTFGHSVSAVVRLGGHRVRAVAWGRAAHRLSRLSAGQRVSMSGTCSPPAPHRAARELVNHVTGRMAVSEVGENSDDGGPAWRAANRVRSRFVRGARFMAPDDAALFAGLVIGDDRAQSRATVDTFRASGLSHLTCVSGQNLLFVLAVFSPLLRRLGPFARLLATLAAVAWFVALTRAEPSVLRAAAMASVGAFNFCRGTAVNGRSVVAVSASGLLLVDPLLAHNIGFLLSVGATAGLAWLSHPLQSALRLPPVVTATVAAQLGTVPVALLVFGRVPVVSLVTNPLAVPVAGFVMLAGIPLSLAASAAPDAVALPVDLFLSVPVRWVALVADAGARAEPHGTAAMVAWALVLVCARCRWSSAGRSRPGWARHSRMAE